MFFVFRRNDGYVGAVNRSTPALGRQALCGWRTSSGEHVTFEVLLETLDWDEALTLITAERA